jgi:hypothetical protein
MTHIATFAAGLILGVIVGTLAAAAFGRHDDRGLLPWFVREGLR